MTKRKRIELGDVERAIDSLDKEREGYGMDPWKLDDEAMDRRVEATEMVRELLNPHGLLRAITDGVSPRDLLRLVKANDRYWRESNRSGEARRIEEQEIEELKRLLNIPDAEYILERVRSSKGRLEAAKTLEEFAKVAVDVARQLRDIGKLLTR